MRITLATYNIHACIGTDGRFDPGRIAGVLRELNADVVAESAGAIVPIQHAKYTK